VSELELRDIHKLQDAQALVAHTPLLPMPLTGELIDLREPANVADKLDKLRDLKRQLDGLRELLETVLRLESKRQGTKTLHLEGGLTAVVSGGDRRVYDAEALADDLADAGLPPERVAEAVKAVVEWKVDQRVLNQLAASNPDYGQIIALHQRREEAPWRVSIRR
jgi:hypothetical protein